MEEFKSIHDEIRKEYPHYFRLAIANYMDTTTGACCYCGFQFNDVDDVIKRDVIFVKASDRNIIACKKCYDNTELKS